MEHLLQGLCVSREKEVNSKKKAGSPAFFICETSKKKAAFQN